MSMNGSKNIKDSEYFQDFYNKIYFIKNQIQEINKFLCDINKLYTNV